MPAGSNATPLPGRRRIAHADVLATGKEGDLVFVPETRQQSRCIPEEWKLGDHFVLTFRGDGCPARSTQVSENAFLELLFQLHIHGLVLGATALTYARETGQIGFVVGHLHLVHYAGGEVVEGGSFVSHKKGLAVYGYLRDRFALDGDGAIIFYLDARHLLQKVLKHVVLADAEGCGVINKGIALDFHRTERGTDFCGFQHFGILLQ